MSYPIEAYILEREITGVVHLELSRHHILQTVDIEIGALDMGSHSILMITLADTSIPCYR